MTTTFRAEVKDRLGNVEEIFEITDEHQPEGKARKAFLHFIAEKLVDERTVHNLKIEKRRT